MSSAFDDEELALTIPGPSQVRSYIRDAAAARKYAQPQPPAARVPQPGHLKKAEKLEKIGAYKIVKTLGEGAFGKVKLALHEVSGQKVALKMIERKHINSSDMQGRIEREVSYLQLLRHPHIIKLYTVITTPTQIIMVLEYADSELFDHIVKWGKQSEDEARRLFQQLICAVEYCHRHKIVHRDLKPENCLMSEVHPQPSDQEDGHAGDEDRHDNQREGTGSAEQGSQSQRKEKMKTYDIKIADFGLSNLISDGAFLKTSCGSPNYAAPEVISGHVYGGPEVDVWSCGVILYVLLVGRLPFDDEYIPTLFNKIANAQYRIPSWFPPGAKNLLKKMLVVKSVDRITIQEIRSDPWFSHNLPDYLQPVAQTPQDVAIDPSKAIDPKMFDGGEKLHENLVGKLGRTMGYAPKDVKEALRGDEPNAIKDAYLVLRENEARKAKEGGQLGAQSTGSLPTVRPPVTPTGSADNRNPSVSSSSVLEARSPVSHIAILTSSLPEYHAAYMRGHKTKPQSPTNEEDLAAGETGGPRTKEDQERTRSMLTPHNKSAQNLRHMAKPEPMTALNDPGKKSKKSKNRWQFGIRSRNSPADAMLAIFKALVKMGAEWEEPAIRRGKGRSSGDSPERENKDRDGSNSPEYSDSDPGPGSDPEYATHEEQERRRAERRKNQQEARGRDRYGRWNDYGYEVPEDPWVINARLKKGGMLPVGAAHSISAKTSREDMQDMMRDAPSSMESSDVPSLEGAAVQHGSRPTNVSSKNDRTENESTESCWMYLTIQLYSIDRSNFLVDFRCAGYERLVHRFAKVLSSENPDAGIVELDRAAGMSKLAPGDITVDEDGKELLGLGRTNAEKNISNPFPFLDVASRLIIQLAEADD